MSQPVKSNLEKVLSGEKILINSDDYVPGTIHLVDIDNVLDVKKDDNSKHNIILQPQPSSNPNDPLRWSQLKKNCQFGLLTLWSMLQAVSLNWSTPFWLQWTVEMNTTLNELNNAFAMGFLFLGLGCVFFSPLSLKLGKRLVYILCSFINLIANIIGTQQSSIGYFYAIKCLCGLAVAPVDAIVEVSATEVFYTHERSTRLSILVLALYVGTDLGPIYSGFTTWQNNYYIQIALLASIALAVIFFLEDTSFPRERESGEKDILRQIKSHDTVIEAVKSGQLSNDLLEKSGANIQTIVSKANSSNGVSANDDESIDHSIKKRTFWQSRRLYETEFTDNRNWFTILIRPFLIPFPALIWGGCAYGTQMMWLALIGVTQSQIFEGYYGFTTGEVGLTNLAPLIGSVIGMFYGGYFVDWLCIKLAERNKGVLEPEYRLWALIFPTIINAGGLLAYGLASDGPRAPWPVPVFVGLVLMGAAMTASGAICLSYAIDCYANLASEALVLILFIRNMIGFGFTFGIQPWLQTSGLTVTTWLMFMICLIVNGFFIVFVIWGKRIRKWTKNHYLRCCDPNYGSIF